MPSSGNQVRYNVPGNSAAMNVFGGALQGLGGLVSRNDARNVAAEEVKNKQLTAMLSAFANQNRNITDVGAGGGFGGSGFAVGDPQQDTDSLKNLAAIMKLNEETTALKNKNDNPREAALQAAELGIMKEIGSGYSAKSPLDAMATMQAFRTGETAPTNVKVGGLFGFGRTEKQKYVLENGEKVAYRFDGKNWVNKKTGKVQKKNGEIIIRRNGLKGTIPESEFDPSTDVLWTSD